MLLLHIILLTCSIRFTYVRTHASYALNGNLASYALQADQGNNASYAAHASYASQALYNSHDSYHMLNIQNYG